MFDLLLRRARLTDDTLTDIAIQDGKIAALGDIDAPAHQTVALNGDVYVSAGWIDSHVHCYPNSPIYHDDDQTAWALPLVSPPWWMRAVPGRMTWTIFTPSPAKRQPRFTLC